MPTYQYFCANNDCVGEFEEYHSIMIKLEECPHCAAAGRGNQPIQRLISGGSGKGIVELSVNELKANLANESFKINQRAAKNENYLANLVGETKYNNNQKAGRR